MSASDRTKTLNDALTSVIASLDKEEELKKSLREAMDPLFDVVRASTAELNKIHSSPSSSHSDIALKTIEIVSSAKDRWLTVASIIPEGEYHRHAYSLGPVIRGLTTNVVFSRFILTDELTPAFQVSDIIGLEQPETKKITLTAEEYLLGVIGMVNELPRLSINSVTAQNYDLPQKIASFVNDIFASYSLLNLRNTELRRKFDSLKYDLKRCEDVVYDLTLRGLTKAPTSA